MEIIVPVNPVGPDRLNHAATQWPNLFGGARRPHIVLLVGGTSSFCMLDEETARRLGQEIRAFAEAAGGTVHALTSSRTGERQFGHGRKYGQKSHDRYELEWREDLDVARPWQEFVAELQGEDYRNFLRRLLEHHALALSFHWHYTPTGCSVSSHCDAKRKLGSHIFYCNTEEDWDPSWGGETLILDDGGRFHPNSARNIEDFDRALGSRALGNYSLPCARKGNSWHGVCEIRSPQGALRKVFIVVITHLRLASRIRDSLLGRHATGY